jgi:hypothetical protein
MKIRSVFQVLPVVAIAWVISVPTAAAGRMPIVLTAASTPVVLPIVQPVVSVPIAQPVVSVPIVQPVVEAAPADNLGTSRARRPLIIIITNIKRVVSAK